MSQVISIKVAANYEEACAAFRDAANREDKSGINNPAEHKFQIFYDESIHEIRCEGDIPDSVFAALVKVKEQFSGRLYYEGEEWNEHEDGVVDEAGALEKVWMFLAIIFFPVTIIYFLLRLFLWVPLKVWKATR